MNINFMQGEFRAYITPNSHERFDCIRELVRQVFSLELTPDAYALVEQPMTASPILHALGQARLTPPFRYFIPLYNMLHTYYRQLESDEFQLAFMRQHYLLRSVEPSRRDDTTVVGIDIPSWHTAQHHTGLYDENPTVHSREDIVQVRTGNTNKDMYAPIFGRLYYSIYPDGRDRDAERVILPICDVGGELGIKDFNAARLLAVNAEQVTVLTEQAVFCARLKYGF
jgi:hypothetical protein